MAMPAQSPEQCDALFAAHLNSGNLEGLVALYEPNALWVQQRDPDARGTAAIRQRLAAFVAIRPAFTSKVTKLIQADENLALLYTDWSVTASGTTLSGKGLQIVRRQPDGTWLIAVDDPFGRIA
jgi:ketosteroid isomerase-like protein